jgi:hypothetical protein
LFAWVVLPAAFLGLRKLLWQGCPPWLTQAALWLLDSSPLGVGMNLLGMPGPGGIVERLLRMMALETAGAALLTLWAASRLRPASRVLEDVEGQRARLRILRQSRRRRPRSPCGDDPVLWNAIHTGRRATVAAWIEGRLIGLVWIGLIALVTSWFAVPAFRELAARGYGAAPEAFTMPAGVNPLSRVLCDKLIMPAGGPADGQARMEFNIVLRLFSGFFGLLYPFAIVYGVAEGVKGERVRDTWLGLLATPLSGWEILRAKMLGPVLKGGGSTLTLIGLWTVGLMAGAVHPVGLLAAFTGLAVSAWFYSAVGVSTSIREGAMERAAHPLAFMVGIVVAIGAAYLLAAISVVLAWSSLLSYEDVHCVVHSGAFPQFGTTKLRTVMGARTVVGVWLAGTTALAAGAFSLTRATCRDFDVTVGRPTRPRGDARQS